MDKGLCISVNINGVRDKFIHIKTLLDIYAPIVLIIIESNIKSINQTRTFPNYTAELWPHNDYKLNLLTYINNSYYTLKQPQQYTDNINTAIYKTFHNNIELNIVGMYIKSGKTIDNRIVIPRINPIVLGDLNARSITFGDTVSKQAGAVLRDYTLANNLKILNYSSPYTFYRQRRNTLTYTKIDLAFSNNNLILKGLKAEMLGEIDSDHLPIIVKIAEPPKQRTFKMKQYQKAHWDEFAAEVDEKIRTLPGTQLTASSIDHSIEKLTKLLNETAEKYIPTKTIKINRKIEDTPYIKNLKAQRNKINRILYRNKSNPNKYLINLKNKINQIIRNHYIDCSIKEQNKLARILNTEKGTDTYWNLINSEINGSNNNSLHSPLIDQNNEPHFTIEKKLEIFQNHYNSIFKELPVPPIPEHQEINNSVNQYFTTNQLNTDENNEPITEIEIVSIIKQKKNKSAPGHDKLHNQLLKNLSINAIKYITTIINYCYQIAYFPSTWKISHITNICKPNKPSTKPTSYRPISLLSSLGKILETIIQTRLQKHIDEHNIVRYEQHGFMPTRGTTDAILSLVESMAEGIIKRAILPTTACFFDMQKAFDTVWHTALINTLIKYNFPLRLITITKSFLTNRSARVKLENKLSNIINIKAGVPQGSVIAPTLYILFINNFPAYQISNPTGMEIEMNRRRQIFQYADDTTIGLSAATRIGAQECLGEWLKLITSWCHINKVQINASKSVQLLFKNPLKRIQQTPQPLTLNGEIIPIKTSTKYLGVTINKHLSWSTEINSRINKTKAHIPIMRSLKYRGITSSTLLHIYKSKIRPLLTHTTPVLGLINKTDLKRIERTERNFLQIIFKPCGEIRKLKTAALYENNQINPIHSFIEQSVKRYLYKNHLKPCLTIRYRDSPLYLLYMKYWPDAPGLALEPG